MFGKNIVAGKRPVAEGFLVKSIFYTIQGEGPWAGYPTVFVRFAGCNLRCFFCDTDFEGGDGYTVSMLAARLAAMAKEHNCTRFVLTGGEPMLQALPELIKACPALFTYQIETAGTIWPYGLENFKHQVVIVCSPKTPTVHAKIVDYADAYKYIITAGQQAADGLPSMSTQIDGQPAEVYRQDKALRFAKPIFVQACDTGDAGLNALNLQAAVDASLKHGYRLSIQMHKIAGLE